MWEEADVACCNLLYWYLPGRTKNGRRSCQIRIETPRSTSQKRGHASHLAALLTARN